MTLARIVSTLLHPIFMPLIGVIIIFQSGIYSVDIPFEFKKFVILVVFLCHILLPLSIIPSLIYFRKVQNVSINERRERLIPLFFTTICFYLGYFIVSRYSPTKAINLYLLSSALVVLLILIISLFWKISIHMSGIGGVTAMIAVISAGYRIDMSFVLCIVLLGTGAMASSRLKLRTHSTLQLFAGYMLGFVSVGVLMLQLII
ncbi:MAG: hypothetical protein JW894_00625 [Bacteroidales bacterium]|nr:hypothetical protein [Bacteroidales bacterium]